MYPLLTLMIQKGNLSSYGWIAWRLVQLRCVERIDFTELVRHGWGSGGNGIPRSCTIYFIFKRGNITAYW